MPGNTNTFGGALRDIQKTAARETKGIPPQYRKLLIKS